MTAVIGIRGHCAQCDMTFELKPWQLNAIAIDEPFECTYCQACLKLGSHKQLCQFRALNWRSCRGQLNCKTRWQ